MSVTNWKYQTMDLKELKEKEADLNTAITQRAALIERESRTYTAEEQAADDNDYAQLEAIKPQIESAERVLRSKKLNISAVSHAVPVAPITQEEHNITLRSWLAFNSGKGHIITDRMRNISERCGVAPDSPEYTVTRAQTVGTANQGGNLVNGAYIVGFEKALKAYGSIVNECHRVPGTTGGPLFYGFNDNTGNRATYIAENTSASGVTRTVTQVLFPKVPKFQSGVEEISDEVLTDASWDVMGWLKETCFDSLARGVNYEGTLGDGTTSGTITKSTGIVTAAGVVETEADDAVTMKDINKLIHSVDYGYRQSGECVFMCHDNFLMYLENLVDENNRPLYVPDYINGTPGRLRGYRVVINNDMAWDITGDEAKVLVFGLLSKHGFRDCGAPKLVSQYLINKDSTSIFAYYRAQFKDLNANGYKIMKMKASS